MRSYELNQASINSRLITDQAIYIIQLANMCGISRSVIKEINPDFMTRCAAKVKFGSEVSIFTRGFWETKYGVGERSEKS